MPVKHKFVQSPVHFDGDKLEFEAVPKWEPPPVVNVVPEPPKPELPCLFCGQHKHNPAHTILTPEQVDDLDEQMEALALRKAIKWALVASLIGMMLAASVLLAYRYLGYSSAYQNGYRAGVQDLKDKTVTEYEKTHPKIYVAPN